MTYGPVRSANEELHEGATDGTYKKVTNDRGGFVETATAQRRASLSDTWYGIHETPVKTTGDTITLPTRGYLPTAPADPKSI